MDGRKNTTPFERNQRTPISSQGFTRASGLRHVTIKRSTNGNEGFGFRLRHFIKYPDTPTEQLGNTAGIPNPSDRVDYLETCFVITVKDHGPAHQAGLCIGDSIVCVNEELVVGKKYSEIVEMIQNSGPVLELVVTSKERDILQKCFQDAAYSPLSNLETPAAAIQSSGAVNLSPSPGSHNKDQQGTFVPNRPVTISHLPRPKPYQPYVCESPTGSSVKWAINASTAGSLAASSQPVLDTKKRAADTIIRSVQKAVNTQTFLNEARSRASLAAARSTAPVPANSSHAPVNKRNSYAGTESAASAFGQIPLDRFRKSHVQKEEFLNRPIQTEYKHSSTSFFKETPPRQPGNAGTPTKPLLGPGSSEAVLNGKNYPGITTLPGYSSLVQNSVPRPFYGSLATSLDAANNHTRVNEAVTGAASLHSPDHHQSMGILQKTAMGETPRPRKLEPVSYRAIKFETSTSKRSPYQTELSLLEEKGLLSNVTLRKREFEASVSAAAVSPLQNDTTPAGSVMEEASRAMSGNRTVIVGSSKLHCEPPKEIHQENITVDTVDSSSSLRLTILSKEDLIANTSSSQTPTPSPVMSDFEQSIMECFESKIASISRNLDDSVSGMGETESQDLQQTQTSSAEKSETNEEAAKAVNKRLKLIHDSRNEGILRRKSYLQATAKDRRHVESYGEEDKPDEENNNSLPGTPTGTTVDSRLQQSPQKPRLRLAVEKSHFLRTFSPAAGNGSPLSPVKENKENLLGLSRSQDSKEGWLHVKQTLADGSKRAHDRSWKRLWVKLRHSVLILARDKRDSPEDAQIDLSLCHMEIATDYTKRKNVIRIHLRGGTEYLLQCEDSKDMFRWVDLIQTSTGGKSSLPTSPAANHSNEAFFSPKLMESGEIPSHGTKSSPNKSVNLPITKPKTWRGPFPVASRRKKKKNTEGQQQQVKGSFFEIPLEHCLRSPFTENVPIIVEICVRIIESHGLDHKGIYRTSGSAATLNALMESMKKGLKSIIVKDPRWNDVNVVANLLKTFFRKLPEPLIPFELYSAFMNAGKIEEENQRVSTIKKLIEDLPEFHYETLRYFVQHLWKVAKNSDVNLMSPNNLAIVLGPTLFRPDVDDAVAANVMAADTASRTRCLETLIEKAEAFFPKSVDTFRKDNSNCDTQQDNETTVESILTAITEAAESNCASGSPEIHPSVKNKLLGSFQNGSFKSLVDLTAKPEILENPEQETNSGGVQVLRRKRSASLGGDSLLQDSSEATVLNRSISGSQNFNDGTPVAALRGSGSHAGSWNSLISLIAPGEKVRRPEQRVKAILQHRQKIKAIKINPLDVELSTSAANYTEGAFPGLEFNEASFVAND